jgi:hypothetical protein
MQIRNPYFPHPNVKCLIDEDTCMCATGRHLEIPDDARSVIIQPIAGGRSDAEVLAPGKAWTPDLGFMELDVWADRMKVMEEKKKLQEEKDAMAARKAKEARERGNQKKAVSEKPKKVVEEKTGEKTCGPKIRLDDDLDMGKKLEL